MVRDRSFAPSAGLDLFSDRIHSLGTGQTVELAGINLCPGRKPGFLQLATIPVGRSDDDPDLKSVLFREYKIALIVRRNTHNSAGPVRRQHVVAHQYRDPFAVQRVDAVRARLNTGLLALGRRSLYLGLATAFFDILIDRCLLCGLGQFFNERVLGGQNDECRAVNGVDPSCKSINLFTRYELAYIETDRRPC